MACLFRPGTPPALRPLGCCAPGCCADGSCAAGRIKLRWWAVTSALVSMIGFSRPYLGVHFVTDVLAGWLLGAAWAGSVILLASWWLDSSRTGRSLRDAVTPEC